MSAPARKPKVTKPAKPPSTEDETDLAEARRILADPTEKRIPYDSVRKEAGLR